MHLYAVCEVIHLPWVLQCQWGTGTIVMHQPEQLHSTSCSHVLTDAPPLPLTKTSIACAWADICAVVVVEQHIASCWLETGVVGPEDGKQVKGLGL